MVDLTRGKLSKRLQCISGTPVWNNFSMGRIREATDINLPTSGHLISHNTEEIKDVLENQDLSTILVLDDTSFSGSTSLLFEDLLKRSFPERSMSFTHGFLILNTGSLGPNPGAEQRLTNNNDTVAKGRTMRTPQDDGWHFFDIANQENITDHLLVVTEIINLIGKSNFNQLATSILTDETNLHLLFPHLLSTQDLEEKRLSGHFLGSKKLVGTFHVRNPQLLPNIIGQNHISKPSDWRGSIEEAFIPLVQLNHLLKKGENE